MMSIFVFYVVAQRERDPANWKRSIALIPMLIAAGVGLTLINTRAVLEAIFGVRTPFVRTAKYAIGSDHPVKLTMRTYRRRSGLLPFVEIGLGTLFLAMSWFAVDTFNFMAVPFLSMFVGGYYWAGFGTLAEEYRGRLRFERQKRELPAETPR